MNPDAALDLIDSALKNLVGTREQHIEMIEAVKLLRNTIKGKV